jgi:hypothetical protein
MYPAGRNQKMNKNMIQHNVIDICQENFSLKDNIYYSIFSDFNILSVFFLPTLPAKEPIRYWFLKFTIRAFSIHEVRTKKLVKKR